MASTPTNYSPPVTKLLTLGDPRKIPTWFSYSTLDLKAAHISDLIRMALDDDLHWADSDSREVWAPLHAWRALGQLQAGEAIEPLLTLLSRIDEFNDDWVGEDLPKAIGLIGQAALEPVARYLADPDHLLWARVAASTSLVEIARRYPDLREQCVTSLTQQLSRFNELDPILNGSIISDLVDLRAVEAAPVIEQAFAAKRVDISILGDWEDTQIELGLLTKRLTPKPNYHLWDRVLGPLLGTGQEASEPPPETPHRQPDDNAVLRARLKTQAEAQRKAKAKAKAKRKQQKKSRQQSRRRK